MPIPALIPGLDTELITGLTPAAGAAAFSGFGPASSALGDGPVLAASVLAPYFPAGVFRLILLATAGGMLGVSKIFGPSRPSAMKSRTYECGAPVLKSARERFSVKFYLVAILFVLFDIETVFLIPWAIKFRELGVFGLIEMAFFMGVLLVGLGYAWMRGGLEWD